MGEIPKIWGSQKGGFQKGGFGWMFPGTNGKNRDEGTFGCSPVPKTRTRAHSLKPNFYETAFCFLLAGWVQNFATKYFSFFFDIYPVRPLLFKHVHQYMRVAIHFRARHLHVMRICRCCPSRADQAAQERSESMLTDPRRLHFSLLSQVPETDVALDCAPNRSCDFQTSLSLIPPCV